MNNYLSRASSLHTQLLTPDSRKKDQLDRWNILNDNVSQIIRDELSSRFSDPDNQSILYQHIDRSLNALKLIISKQSVVYKSPARRFFTEDNDTILWNAIVTNLDLILEQVNRVTMCCNECLIRPVVRNSALDFDILLPHKTEVEYDGINITGIIFQLADDSYQVWFADTVVLLDPKGIEIGTSVNPYGFIPFVCFRRRHPTEGFWLGSEGEDLKALYLDQVISRSRLNCAMYYQSHLQLTRKLESRTDGLSMPSSENIALGPHQVLEGDYQTLNLQSNLEAYERTIENKLIRGCSAHGISEGVLNTKVGLSGLSIYLAQIPLQEIRDATIKMFRPSELELITLACRLWNMSTTPDYPKFSTMVEPSIDYADTQIISTEKERLDSLELGMKLGVKTPLDYIMENNPEIRTREEAKEALQQNLEEIKYVLELRQKYMLPSEYLQGQGLQFLSPPTMSEAQGKIGGEDNEKKNES